GGEVAPSQKREYGKAIFNTINSSPLFYGIPDKFVVWMSHGDKLKTLPKGFKVIGKSENSEFCAIEKGNIYGVQFHPEVYHTQFGKDILKNFLYNICKARGDWKLSDFLKEKIDEIKSLVKNEKVILALSGGVDSTVLAKLLEKALGNNLYLVFVNTGLLKDYESERLKKLFQNNLFIINEKNRFLNALKGVIDPEEKRKIVGREFINVFRDFVKNLNLKIKFLAQGTLYPDVIESKRVVGPSDKIKTHHNVGGLPEDLEFELIEPFKFLFKDEVRKIGKLLDLSDDIIHKHPFPGPGYAVRIIGEVNEEKLRIIKSADLIVEEEIRNFDLYDKIWQAFAILLPVKSVGIMGDRRTYEYVIAIRIVESEDGMTADWSKVPYNLLERISNRITNEVLGVNRVVYDITSKPPATIEWE
ncbi:MAG: glutamine-hydrolyzing GMP synthase, partial [candidate division WOR-3 bacterium]